jgi:hypothetical protein
MGTYYQFIRYQIKIHFGVPDMLRASSRDESPLSPLLKVLNLVAHA